MSDTITYILLIAIFLAVIGNWYADGQIKAIRQELAELERRHKEFSKQLAEAKTAEEKLEVIRAYLEKRI